MNNDTVQTVGSLQPSRNDLLNWVNSLTKSNITRVEQLGSGISYCQIVELTQPSKVTALKVNPKAKTQYQFINNFKMLQQCFSKLGIFKNIEIQRLVKCKYQDNFQFLQWFYKYFQPQNSRRSSLNTSNSKNEISNRSLPRRDPSPLVPHNISKIERRQVENGSFDQVLNGLDLQKVKTSACQDSLVFYRDKLEQLRLMLQTWDGAKDSVELCDKVQHILMKVPDEVVVLQELSPNGPL